MKFLQLTVVLTIIFSMAFATTVSANTFSDVPSNHAALEAIRWVSSPANGSYMVGDASNNFNPDRVMDSFEAAIILAMAAGFRHSPVGLTPADQAAFDQAYENHSQTLADMAAQYSSWRRVANREIAFLLELEILTPEDLTRFMAIGSGGVQSVAPLTREAAIAFVLRLADKQEQANAVVLPAASPFSDDSEISSKYRRYAYLARELGLITASASYFYPSQSVTRAAFAQMCHNLRIAAPGTPGSTPAANTNSPFARTFHGTIASLQGNTINITTNGETDSYTFSPNPIIVIDNARREVSDLAPGMLVAVGLNPNQQIISLLARTSSTPTPMATPTPTPTPTPTAPPAQQNVPHTIQGHLASRHLEGQTPVLTIETEGGNLHKFLIQEDTYITRNGEPQEWTDLRIGDTLSAQIQSGRLANIQAQGQRATVQGILEEIHIIENLVDTITILRANGTSASFVLPPDTHDIYDLRLGMELRLNLESREIYELFILNDPDDPEPDSTASFIGQVQSIRHGHTIVVVREDGERQTIRIISSTINTATGRAVNFNNIRNHMRLYFIMDSDSDTAQSITILP